jgi:hypothetical protein
LAPDENPLEFSDGGRVVKQPMTWQNISDILNDYHIKAREDTLWTKVKVSGLRSLLRDDSLLNCSDLFSKPNYSPLKSPKSQTSPIKQQQGTPNKYSPIKQVSPTKQISPIKQISPTKQSHHIFEQSPKTNSSSDSDFHISSDSDNTDSE